MKNPWVISLTHNSLDYNFRKLDPCVDGIQGIQRLLLPKYHETGLKGKKIQVLSIFPRAFHIEL